MKSLRFVGLALFATGMFGCASGLQVIDKPNKTDKMAIVMFQDCAGSIDCPGSGKKVTDFYSEVLGAPVIMFEADAKGFDTILKGRVTGYNEAVPMAFNPNIVGVELGLNRVSDSKLLVKQVTVKTGSNVFSSTKGLSKALAGKLKDVLLD